MELYASCPTGFEDALADELRALGLARVRKLQGRVAFEGDAGDAYQACLWSHLASRVLTVLARFSAPDADALYAAVRAMPWERILRLGATIAVSANGSNDRLRDGRFAALRVKDAVCDHMMEVAGVRPSIDTERPDAHLVLSIRGNKATLSFDLSGEPLFRRLPRAATRHASGPSAHVLRPDYAALLLYELGLPEACRAFHDDPDAPAPAYVDISCAGGGAELEAALMLADRAPGVTRRTWGFMGWAQHDEAAWERVRNEAARRAETGARRMREAGAVLVATDADARARGFAKRLFHLAGIEDVAHIVEPDLHAVLVALPSGPDKQAGEAGARGGMLADTTELPLTLAPAVVALARELRSHAPFDALPAAALSFDEVLSRALGPASGERAVRPNNEEATIKRFGPMGASAGTPADLPAGSSSMRSAGAVAPENAREDVAEPSGAGGDGGRAEDAASTGSPSAKDMRRRAQKQKPQTSESAETLATVDVGQGKPVPVLVPESEQFARRLMKVARLRRRWAKREGVTCYRVYDADLPDYAAAIDLYEGSAATPGRWLVVAEYAAPKSVDPALAQARMLDILAIAPRVLDVEPAHVYAKARMRSRGGSQYAQKPRSSGAGAAPHARQAAGRGSSPHGVQTGQGTGHGAPRDRKLPLIEEGGLTFAVNFDDYLDTGIFLDHRVTRGMVRERARGKRWFLNLFAYTGTATCYAADAGVEETVTVDLSNTYLDWAERNMELNRFTGGEHHFVRADVLAWIRDMRRTANRWDLIFCDPPTFSNSAKMSRRSFDVQRDHVELLEGVAGLLTPGGEAIFSCNLRTFKPRVEELAAAGVAIEDITAQTIPEDFSRNPRIHKCYLVRRMS
ncbi:class I SAM-dependent methyltransferase [Enorma phocaeensis]|uniref:Ribosomal RNA large subunit methyltransferase K/L n=1 Tax=Enorma phocaeensis TaxID=1871019 RepID=A0ABT7VBK1_9ACTN|nr:class I SAM-dependent methyltransferase [Enorma phocaeensis]MDM8275764.1 class I SAM-dependent methyltransferase [Enorma phocaeensis]